MLKRLSLLLITFAAGFAMIGRAAIIPDNIAAQFDGRVTAAIEGVWQFADDGATIAIYADNNTVGDYVITCLDSPDLRLAQGATLGWAKSSLNDGTHYKANLFTNVTDAGTPTKAHDFNVTLNGNTLEMTIVKSGLKFDLWMLYRFYVTMSLRHKNDNSTLKARRIYPSTPTTDSPLVL
jgi:hypothetical protein